MMYYLVKPIVWLLSKIPLSVLHGIGRFLAMVVWAISKERRKVATINAKIVGASNPEKVARKSFDYTFMAYLETFYAHNVDDKFIKDRVTITGLEHFEEAKKNNIPIMLVGGHFGSWAMFAIIFSKAVGVKIVTIGRASHNELIDNVVAKLRTFDTVGYVTHRGAIEQLPSYFEKGYIAGVYLDHTATEKDCVNVPFYGYKTPTIAGMYAIAARKKMSILPMFLRFCDNGKYEIIIKPLVHQDLSLKGKERIIKLATDVNKVYEEVFSMYPEQWYLIHRRFKRVEVEDGSISDSVYRS